MTKQPVAKFEIITPDDARDYLAKNRSNRSVDHRRVAQYCREMSLNRWIINGDAVRFDINNQLIDGQHRLEAITKNNTPQECLIVRNLPEEAFYTIDTGKNRSGSDILSIKGLMYTARTATAARYIYTNDNPNLSRNLFDTRGRRITNTDIINIVDNYSGLPDAVAESARGYPKLSKLIGGGALSALFFILKSKSYPLLVEYFLGLETGANLDMNSVTYQVREKLLSLVGAGFTSTEACYKMSVVVIGWNLMRDGFHDVRVVIPANAITTDIK